MTAGDQARGVTNVSRVCQVCPGRCCSKIFGYSHVSLSTREAEHPVFASKRARRTGQLDWIIPFSRHGCPYLKGGLCSIYEDRPAECRTYQCFDNPHAARQLSFRKGAAAHVEFLMKHGQALHSDYDPEQPADAVNEWKLRLTEARKQAAHATRIPLTSAEAVEAEWLRAACAKNSKPHKIHKMKKQKKGKTREVEQLVLNLTLIDPPQVLRRMVDVLKEISDLDDHVQASTERKSAGAERDGARAKVRRLALIVAIQDQRPVAEIWVLAYHEFAKRTRFHPVSESLRQGLETHLDAVERYGDNGLDILADILDKFLTRDSKGAA